MENQETIFTEEQQREFVSSSLTLWPLFECLNRSQQTSVGAVEWNPSTEKLNWFFNLYKENKSFSTLFSDEELEGMWGTVEEVNEFAIKHGFSIQLKEIERSAEWLSYGLAGLFHVFVEWTKTGEECTVFNYEARKSFDAVKITDFYDIFTSPVHPNPIARIYTRSGDELNMTIFEGELSDKNFLTTVEILKNTMQRTNKYKDVMFPKVDYDEEIDISWMTDLVGSCSIGPAFIAQALQQTKFSLDKEGARVKSLSLMEMTISGCCDFSVEECKPAMIIDKPFLLWMERDGLPTPFFYGKFDLDTWRPEKEIVYEV